MTIITKKKEKEKKVNPQGKGEDEAEVVVLERHCIIADAVSGPTGRYVGANTKGLL